MAKYLLFYSYSYSYIFYFISPQHTYLHKVEFLFVSLLFQLDNSCFFQGIANELVSSVMCRRSKDMCNSSGKTTASAQCLGIFEEQQMRNTIN